MVIQQPHYSLYQEPTISRFHGACHATKNFVSSCFSQGERDRRPMSGAGIDVDWGKVLAEAPGIPVLVKPAEEKVGLPICPRCQAAAPPNGRPGFCKVLACRR
jgi:hypothetical protein